MLKESCKPEGQGALPRAQGKVLPGVPVEGAQIERSREGDVSYCFICAL